MPTTTATRTTGIPRSTPDVGPWPDGLAHLLPPAVKDASDALGEALERREGAWTEEQAARDGVDAARREDSEQAISAADLGHPPPKPTLPKAQAKAEAAERATEALQVLVLRRQEAFLDVLRSSHGQLRTTVAGEAAEVAAGVREKLDGIEAGLRQLAALQDAQRELGEDPGDLTGRYVRFMPPRSARRRDRERDLLSGERRRHLDALREVVRQKDEPTGASRPLSI